MDLIKLDSQFQAGPLIENYDSLIWTERYNQVGDFQIQTGNTDFMDILPKGSVVSLRESTVPMVVRRHFIERKKNQPVKLTIVGKEFTHKVLNQRVSIQSVASALAEWKVVAKQPSDVAHYIMYKICVEGVCDPLDIFPPEQVQFITPADYLQPERPSRTYTVPRGKLLATILGFLQSEADADPDTVPPSPKIEPHGIRAIRPDMTGTAIGIEIYKGQDLRNFVRFEATRDMLDDGSYLFSDEKLSDTAYVLGPTEAIKLHRGENATSGLDRSVTLVDASTSGVAEGDILKQEGIRALSEAKEIARFDGSINQDLSPYTYNVNYGLGDIVMTVGDYGLVTPSRVTEYIRSEDSTGRKAYPTLVSMEKETTE